MAIAVNQPSVVLVRPATAGYRTKRFSMAPGSAANSPASTPRWRHVDPVLVEAQVVHDPLLAELTDRDDRVAALSRTVIAEPPVSSSARERFCLRSWRWCPAVSARRVALVFGRGEGTVERIVDDVRLSEGCAVRSWRTQPSAAMPDATRSIRPRRSPSATIETLTRREVRGTTRHCDPNVEVGSLRQAARKLGDVGLATTHAAGNQVEHRHGHPQWTRPRGTVAAVTSLGVVIDGHTKRGRARPSIRSRFFL